MAKPFMTFESHPEQAVGYLADTPARLPLDVLLALPDYVTADPGAPVFNLPGTVGRLLGGFGWERASGIIRPWVWAPGWRTEDLQNFAASQFTRRPWLLEGTPSIGLAAIDFPGAGGLADLSRPDFPQYSIVHLLGQVVWKDGERTVLLSEADGIWLRQPALRTALRAARTRLFVLHVPVPQHDDAARIAQLMAAGGGPATIVLSSEDPSVALRYLSDLYADIVHNKDLEDVARPGRDAPALVAETREQLRVDLFLAAGDREVLRFDRYLAEVRDQVASTTQVLEATRKRTAKTVATLKARAAPVVHASQSVTIGTRLSEATDHLGMLSDRADSLSGNLMNNIAWAQESTGTEPLVRLADELSAFEATVAEAATLPEQLEAEVETIIADAPRVLNANFADAETRKVIGEWAGLVAGREYDLLVDIGPRWSKIASIVTGEAEFPIAALPPDPDGHEIEVLLLSDSFQPIAVSGRLWVPQSNGRSHPWTEDGPGIESGPIALRITAPTIVNPRARTRRVRARLFIYYEQNLLQSAVVSVGVVRKPTDKLDRRNRINVDYALSSTFNNVGTRFARRNLRMTADGPKDAEPVRVNVTLNNDGAGSHRIIVQGRDDLPTAWTAYDPSAAKGLLDDARREITNCFWERSRNDASVQLDAQGKSINSLNADNGKAWESFLLDLLALAKVGNRLYDAMFHSIRPSDGAGSQAEWERKLRSTLERSSVIQIARIDWTPAQYAFPWAVLYEYPLPGTQADWRYCEVLKEWDKQGRRTLPIANACPFAAAPWHSRDVLCPYGFWGLKHIIEQPLASAAAGAMRDLRDAVQAVRVPAQASVSIGWTRDLALDLASIDRHIQQVCVSTRLRLVGPPPNPGEDRKTMEALLPKANLVYLLCHCERASDENQPYLSLGVHDGNEARKIYASTITDWARGSLPDWPRLSPIVIVNGCHTGDVAPGEILNFISAFAVAGASGVVSTEVSIQLPIAIEVGESLIDKIVNVDGGTVGQALRDIRWQLANKGNLVGLAYGAYGLADLGFVQDG